MLSDRARDAALTMVGYIAGTYPTVSAEQADAAAKRLFEELDKLETIVRALVKHHATGVVVGFLLGVLLALQAVVVGGSHP